MRWIQPDLRFAENSRGDYERKGFAFLGRILTDEGLAAARVHMDRMIGMLHPGLKPDEIYSAHQIESWLLELVSAAELLDIVDSVIGPDIVVWSTHFICKPPGSGRPIPWHQDATYWNVSGRMTSVWIAFDDVSEENGTMYVLPGFHTVGSIARQETGSDFFEEEIPLSALPSDVEERQVGYFLQAGEAAMHHVMIPHRSSPNRSADRWRRVLVIRYISASGELGAKEYPDYRTAVPFARKFILVRGEDTRRQGLEHVSDCLDALAAGRRIG